ncbi:MAG: hypothetical protein NT135_02445 [Candidatus Berkelbacteria bacterium]|nr:hypothetical protein [Candidatus Berkelbacteria bacterium]
MIKNSFTLIELLVTVFIIVLLTAASVPMMRQFQRRAELKSTALEIKSEILEAKNYSLAPRLMGTSISSYAVVFYGSAYLDAAKRNSYEIKECQGLIDGDGKCDPSKLVTLFSSSKKLPGSIVFDVFDWANNATDTAEINFAVEKQGEIVTSFTTPSNLATVKLNKTSEKYWQVVVTKATGNIRVCEQDSC